MSLSFNLAKRVEEYLVAPIMHAPDLGSSIFTGARSGPAGKLVIAVNWTEVPQTAVLDYTPYQTGSNRTSRYRLAYNALIPATIPGATTAETVVVQPGEVIVWVFPATDSPLAGTTVLAFNPTSVANGARVVVRYSYVSPALLPEQSGTITCTSPCSVTLDRSLGAVYYDYKYLSATDAVLVESNVHFSAKEPS